jgi:hypothetical protein
MVDQQDGDTAVEVRRISGTAAELRNRPDAAALVAEELQPEDVKSPRQQKPCEILLAFMPVTFPEQVRCGEGSEAAFAIVWMGSCGMSPSVATAGFGDGTTFVIAHEMVHALGAVPRCAPHYGRNGHVVDDPTDLPYYGRSRGGLSDARLDPGHDDYHDTGRDDCWDITGQPVWTKAK